MEEHGSDARQTSSDDILGLNFFDRLRRGIASIEATTQDIKAQVKRELLRPEINLSDDELFKVKKFDKDIRAMYTMVSTTYNKINDESSPVDQIEKDIIDLDKQIEQFIDEKGLKQMGYRPPQNVFAEIQKVLAESPEPQSQTNNEQITIEFTPGLTTRRPAPIRRVKVKEESLPGPIKTPTPIRKVQRYHVNNEKIEATDEIARSLKAVNVDYERYFTRTPKQPPLSKKTPNSAHAVNSIKKDLSETPRMPQQCLDYKSLLASSNIKFKLFD